MLALKDHVKMVENVQIYHNLIDSSVTVLLDIQGILVAQASSTSMCCRNVGGVCHAI